ncbi:MAG: glycine cleavage system aminomethyltransferase GcvT [Acetivibrionales bacterium]|jgi:aminomethyltransferase
MEDQGRKTPLYEYHREAGGKIVNFHGWLLPVQYGGILQEHECVRTRAGLFDVSHMGEIEVSGEDSAGFLQWILTNNIAAKPGKAVYSPMCYPDGGTVDDLIVYKQADNRYLLVVNASNTAKDFQWLIDNKKGRVDITDRTEEFAQLAIQGPKSADILKRLVALDIDKLSFFSYVNDVQAGDVTVMMSRTGYTGEDGFELYCRAQDAQKLWDMLMEAGKPYGMEPAGLGARDTLRMEAALPLYGHELSESISPVMAGLQRFVKADKGDFIGREPLLAQVMNGPGRKLAGLEMIDRAVPRNGYKVFRGGVEAGYVTSGGFFPTLKKNMCLALLDTATCGDNNAEVQVRGRMYAAREVELPFYKRKPAARV